MKRRLEYPPKCSEEWTTEERIRLVSWIMKMTLDRIDGDDPRNPVLAKTPIRDLTYAMWCLLNESVEFLEENRAAFEKPFVIGGGGGSVVMLATGGVRMDN